MALTSKRVLSKKVIVAGIVVLVALPLILGVLSGNKQSLPTQKQSNVKEKPATTTILGSSYALYYPSSWKAQSGKDVYLFLPSTTQKSGNEHIVVQIVDEKQIPLSHVTAGYVILKYQKREIALPSGITADKYSLVYPASEGILHSIAYVYVVNGTIYHFKLGYTGEAANPQLESAFSQLVTSFRVTN